MGIPGFRSDPLPAFNFYIILIDSSSPIALAKTAIGAVTSGGFMECSGLEGTLQVEDYMEGGENGYVHKFATRMAWSNIVLKRGVSGDDLWSWHQDFVKGKGKRRDGIIFLQDEMHIPVKHWIFKRGMPLKWTGPALNAAQSAVAVESLEIVHEGLEQISALSIAGSAASAVGGLL